VCCWRISAPNELRGVKAGWVSCAASLPLAPPAPVLLLHAHRELGMHACMHSTAEPLPTWHPRPFYGTSHRGQTARELCASSAHTNTHVYTHAQAHANAHTHTHAHTRTRAHMHTHTCTHTHARMHARTHARTHARMHIHTHANLQARALCSSARTASPAPAAPHTHTHSQIARPLLTCTRGPASPRGSSRCEGSSARDVDGPAPPPCPPAPMGSGGSSGVMLVGGDTQESNARNVPSARP